MSMKRYIVTLDFKSEEPQLCQYFVMQIKLYI